MVSDAVGHVRRVAVFGGSSDIGAAIAARLVGTRGATEVVLLGRDPDAMTSVAQRLEALGATVAPERWDATDTPAQHDDVVTRVFAKDVDVVVYAAAQLGDQLADEADPQRSRDLVDVNFGGAVSTLAVVGDRMRAQGHGTLLVLSTIAAVQPRRANFLYGATKAGLDAYARGLGDALAGAGARVVVVRPGFVHSKMTAGMDGAPFSVTPDAVAEAAVKALDGTASVVWVPAALSAVGKVMMALPRPVVRRLPR